MEPRNVNIFSEKEDPTGVTVLHHILLQNDDRKQKKCIYIPNKRVIRFPPDCAGTPSQPSSALSHILFALSK